MTEFSDAITGKQLNHCEVPLIPMTQLLYKGEPLVGLLAKHSRILRFKLYMSVNLIKCAYWSRGTTSFTFIVELPTDCHTMRKQIICEVGHSGNDWCVSKWLPYMPRPGLDAFWLKCA